MNSRNKRRPDWSKLGIQYSNRDCTQEEFCKRHGVKASTLWYHLQKMAVEPSFLPALRESEPTAEIVLELPAGIKLTLRR